MFEMLAKQHKMRKGPSGSRVVRTLIELHFANHPEVLRWERKRLCKEFKEVQGEIRRLLFERDDLLRGLRDLGVNERHIAALTEEATSSVEKKAQGVTGWVDRGV